MVEIVARKKLEPKSELVEFGRQLRSIRERRGISQAGLAEAAGVHPVTISRLEAGLYDVTLTTLQAIAKALKVAPTTLLRSIRSDADET